MVNPGAVDQNSCAIGANRWTKCAAGNRGLSRAHCLQTLGKFHFGGNGMMVALVGTTKRTESRFVQQHSIEILYFRALPSCKKKAPPCKKSMANTTRRAPTAEDGVWVDGTSFEWASQRGLIVGLTAAAGSPSELASDVPLGTEVAMTSVNRLAARIRTPQRTVRRPTHIIMRRLASSGEAMTPRWRHHVRIIIEPYRQGGQAALQHGARNENLTTIRNSRAD